MNPLKIEQQILTWFCICPPSASTGQLRKLIYTIFSIAVVTAIASLVIASAAYFRKYMAIDFEEAFDGLHPVFGWTPLVCIFIVMRLLKLRIVAIFDALSNIYNKRKLKELIKINKKKIIKKKKSDLRNRRRFNSIFDQGQ